MPSRPTSVSLIWPFPPRKIIMSGDIGRSGAERIWRLVLLRFHQTKKRYRSCPPSICTATLESKTPILKPAQSPPRINNNRHAGTDILAGEFTAWGVIGLIKGTPDHASPLFFPPKNHPFSAHVPIWIQLGRRVGGAI